MLILKTQNPMVLFTHAKRLILLMLVFAFGCSINTFAQGTGTKEDPYILENGGEYPVKVFQDFYGIFIVPEDVTTDDTVLEIVSYNWLQVYSDEALENLVSQTTGSYAPYTTKVNIPNGTKKGTTYYAYIDFPMENQPVKVSYGSATPLQLSNVIPAQGSVLSAGESYVSLEFNMPISFQSCLMQAGNSIKPVVANQTDRFISIEAKNELVESYKSGALKEGDKISFIFTNVTSYDKKSSLGTLTIDYIAAPKPMMLISTVLPTDTILKSWMPTNKQDGLIELKFDGKLNQEANITAVLSYGDLESDAAGEYYRESLTPTIIDDNTLTIDLRGKLRTPELMVNSGKIHENILLTIRGVEDEFGYASYTLESGSSGAYFINLGYELINYEIMTEFVPASGKCIDNVNEIVIWMQESGGNISYSGAQFEYTLDGEIHKVLVDANNIKTEIDEEDETAHYVIIPIPSFSRDANTQVLFSFTDVQTPDGYNYDKYLTAVYTTQGATGITSVLQEKSNQIYALDGKKVTSVKKSHLYIINGKKTLVK
jgi:hypothetical protein